MGGHSCNPAYLLRALILRPASAPLALAGNGAEADEWEGSSFNPDLLSPEERALYEEKKLKMRKVRSFGSHD